MITIRKFISINSTSLLSVSLFFRFACICTSSGKVHVITIRADGKLEKAGEDEECELVRSSLTVQARGWSVSTAQEAGIILQTNVASHYINNTVSYTLLNS